MSGLVDDICEVKQLLATAKRPRVSSALTTLLSTMERELRDATKALPTPAAPAVAAPPPGVMLGTGAVSERVMYTDVAKYAWDQTDAAVKLYFTLDGVNGDAVGPTDVTLTCTESMVEFTLRGVRAYRLAVAPLSKSIVPGKCAHRVKPNGNVVLTLAKAAKETWYDLKAKDAPKKEDKKTDSGAPEDSIMKLMKDMYNDGDDEMKKTIAKAWTEGQEKRGRGGEGM